MPTASEGINLESRQFFCKFYIANLDVKNAREEQIIMKNECEKIINQHDYAGFIAFSVVLTITLVACAIAMFLNR